MKAVIVNDMIGLITGVDEDGDAVVEFGGSYQLQISKVDNEWKVTNGVNGYGNNCRKEFEDATVIPLYESPAPDGWVSVETELPKPEQNVIVSFLSGEKRRTAIGFYTPKYHTEYEGDNEDFGDYSEENGGITYCPEGWYEHTWEHEEHYMMKNVTHWQPLPQPPKQ